MLTVGDGSMYTIWNFKTKKELKMAIADGKKVGVFQPGGLDNTDYSKFSGQVTLEGPHYPAPHKWYAGATLVDGYITKVS
jgi:hypothetical protein